VVLYEGLYGTFPCLYWVAIFTRIGASIEMIRRMKSFTDEDPGNSSPPSSAPKKGINIVLYPREYMVDGNAEHHHVRGITRDGRIVNVRLKIEDEYLNSLKNASEKMVPRLSEFARTDLKAPRPCLSSEDNSPEHREGVLLFSKAHAVNDEETDYVAGWAVVLAETADHPDPMFALGRMQIDPVENAKCRGIKNEYNKLSLLVNTPQHTADIDRQLSRLEREHHEETNFRFRAFMIKPEEIVRIKTVCENELRAVITPFLDRYTRDGMYGGCFIRVIDKKTGLVTKMSSRVETYFDRGIVGPEQAYVEFMYGRKDDAGLITRGGRGAKMIHMSEDIIVDIIPMQCINCGPLGIKLHKEKEQYDSLFSTYTDPHTELPMLCDIAIRPWVNPQTGNTLLARIYAASPMKGNEFELGSDGHFTFRLEGKSYTGAVDYENAPRRPRAPLAEKIEETPVEAVVDKEVSVEVQVPAKQAPVEPDAKTPSKPVEVIAEVVEKPAAQEPAFIDIADPFDFDAVQADDGDAAKEVDVETKVEAKIIIDDVKVDSDVGVVDSPNKEEEDDFDFDSFAPSEKLPTTDVSLAVPENQKSSRSDEPGEPEELKNIEPVVDREDKNSSAVAVSAPVKVITEPKVDVVEKKPEIVIDEEKIKEKALAAEPSEKKEANSSESLVEDKKVPSAKEEQAPKATGMAAFMKQRMGVKSQGDPDVS